MSASGQASGAGLVSYRYLCEEKLTITTGLQDRGTVQLAVRLPSGRCRALASPGPGGGAGRAPPPPESATPRSPEGRVKRCDDVWRGGMAQGHKGTRDKRLCDWPTMSTTVPSEHQTPVHEQ